MLDAALALLRENGLAGVTTSALARLAGCSKDTLYLLFENRDAILAALVERQAEALNAILGEAVAGQPTIASLEETAARLLRLLTSEESLTINRAALADSSGALSAILIAAGREKAAPGILRLIERLDATGAIRAPDATEAYGVFYGLAVGDRQILALHGAGSATDVAATARRAVAQFVRLYAPDVDRR